MNAYPCIVTNASGQTIWIKIVGYHWDMFSMPVWPGPNNDGLLFAATVAGSPVQQGYAVNLLEGDRVVVVFNNTGSFLAATNVLINAPATITIGPGGNVTATYSAGPPIPGGN
jgi:hypothetical protein